MGIEPTSPAWKAGALTVVLYPLFKNLGFSHYELLHYKTKKTFPNQYVSVAIWA